MSGSGFVHYWGSRRNVMKVLLIVLLMAVGAAAATSVRADDAFSLPGIGSFGIAPAPSNLVGGEALSTKSDVKPLEAVLAAIDRRLPGRALGARLVEWRGRQAYAIRWIGEDGKVRDITADAVSGDILRER
jgi:hypothetical protein